MLGHCSGCGRSVQLDEANCVVHAYYYLSWMAWFEFFCTFCTRTNEKWMGANYQEQLETFTTKSAIGFVIEEIPSDEVIYLYNQGYDIELLRSQPLTPSQEHLVEYFAWLLEKEEASW